MWWWWCVGNRRRPGAAAWVSCCWPCPPLELRPHCPEPRADLPAQNAAAGSLAGMSHPARGTLSPVPAHLPRRHASVSTQTTPGCRKTQQGGDGKMLLDCTAPACLCSRAVQQCAQCCASDGAHQRGAFTCCASDGAHQRGAFTCCAPTHLWEVQQAHECLHVCQLHTGIQGARLKPLWV